MPQAPRCEISLHVDSNSTFLKISMLFIKILSVILSPKIVLLNGARLYIFFTEHKTVVKNCLCSWNGRTVAELQGFVCMT